MEKTALTDAKQMAIDHPITFERASEAELSELEPNDFVKVCAEPERFWVKLKAINGTQLIGTVHNDLVASDKHGWEFGDRIELHVDQVYNTMDA